MPKLTRKLIGSLVPTGAEFCVWDTQVTGFGVRVQKGGGRSYVLFYRLGGKFRRLTLGRADGGYGLDEARDRALDRLQDVRDGVDPQVQKVAERNALTVAELVDLYLEQGPALKPNKKESSWATNRTLLERHVKPLLGRRLARDLTRMDIARFQLDVSQGKTARNVMVGPRRRSKVTGGKRGAALSVITLGAAYEFAISLDRLSKNPTKGVERFQTVRRERYLSEREFAALAEALVEFEREDERHTVMADAVRLLILTGCRKSEILSLKWEFVDWHKGCFRLPESKTGAKVEGSGAPRISLRVDYGSGGGAYDGGTIRNGLTPLGVPIFYSYQNVFNPVNMIAVAPGVTVRKGKTSVTGEVQFTWRASERDAVYRATDLPYAGTEAVDGRRIGEVWKLQLAHTISSRASVIARYEHLAAGSVLKDAGYESSDYLTAWVNLRF